MHVTLVGSGKPFENTANPRISAQVLICKNKLLGGGLAERGGLFEGLGIVQ